MEVRRTRATIVARAAGRSGRRQDKAQLLAPALERSPEAADGGSGRPRLVVGLLRPATAAALPGQSLELEHRLEFGVALADGRRSALRAIRHRRL